MEAFQVFFTQVIGRVDISK